MSARLADLKTIPLDELLPRAIARLRDATLDELADLLAPRGALAAPGQAPAKSGTLDDFAKAVIDLPSAGSKLNAAERAVVLHALATCDGNVSAAARLLGVDRKALERRVRRIKRSKR